MTLGMCLPFYPTAPVAQKLMFQNHMMLYIIGKEILRWLIPKMFRFWDIRSAIFPAGPVLAHGEKVPL